MIEKKMLFMSDRSEKEYKKRAYSFLIGWQCTCDSYGVVRLHRRRWSRLTSSFATYSIKQFFNFPISSFYFYFHSPTQHSQKDVEVYIRKHSALHSHVTVKYIPKHLSWCTCVGNSNVLLHCVWFTAHRYIVALECVVWII